jgi:hypothetical protein
MYNDSIETLLLRHYGHHGPTPDDLEQRIINSVRQDAIRQQQEERAVTRVLKHRMSRRRAMKLVTIGSAGLGLVAASLEVLDATLFGRDTTQSVSL